MAHCSKRRELCLRAYSVQGALLALTLTVLAVACAEQGEAKLMGSVCLLGISRQASEHASRASESQCAHLQA